MAESLYTGSETSIPIGDAGGDHNSLVDDDCSIEDIFPIDSVSEPRRSVCDSAGVTMRVVDFTAHLLQTEC